MREALWDQLEGGDKTSNADNSEERFSNLIRMRQETGKTDSYQTIPSVSTGSEAMSVLDSNTPEQRKSDGRVGELKEFLRNSTTLPRDQIAQIQSFDDLLKILQEGPSIGESNNRSIRDSDGGIDATSYRKIAEIVRNQEIQPNKSIEDLIKSSSYLATEIGGMIDTDSETEALKTAINLASEQEEKLYIMDIGQLRERMRVLKEMFLPEYKNSVVAISVKTNNLPIVLEIANQEGLAFECASCAEIDMAKQINPNARLLYSNPIRSETDAANALRGGVDYYSVQSNSGVSKIIRNMHLAPRDKNIEIAFRVGFNNEGAEINLSCEDVGKFGMERAEIIKSINTIRRNVEIDVGLTVHLGSQNTEIDSIPRGINKLARLAEEVGGVSSINVAPGIPSPHSPDDDYVLEDFIKEINEGFTKYIGSALDSSSKAEIIMEVGRGIAGPCEMLIIPVTELDVYNGARRMHVDESVFGSFTDVPLHGMEYWFEAYSRDGEKVSGDLVKWNVFGNSCDSGDKIAELYLPENIQEKDCLVVRNAGAYMASQHSGSEKLGGFNGIKKGLHYLFNYK